MLNPTFKLIGFGALTVFGGGIVLPLLGAAGLVMTSADILYDVTVDAINKKERTKTTEDDD